MKGVKLFCWIMLVVCSLTVLYTLGHAIRSRQINELQVGVIFAMAALAFNASLLLDKAKKKERRRSTDNKGGLWPGTRWVGAITILCSYGTAFFYCIQGTLAVGMLRILYNLFMIFLALAVAVVVESKVFSREVKLTGKPASSGGVS